MYLVLTLHAPKDFVPKLPEKFHALGFCDVFRLQNAITLTEPWCW